MPVWLRIFLDFRQEERVPKRHMQEDLGKLDTSHFYHFGICRPKEQVIVWEWRQFLIVQKGTSHVSLCLHKGSIPSWLRCFHGVFDRIRHSSRVAWAQLPKVLSGVAKKAVKSKRKKLGKKKNFHKKTKRTWKPKWISCSPWCDSVHTEFLRSIGFLPPFGAHITVQKW